MRMEQRQGNGRILLVEDDANQVLLYRSELEAEGYDVVVASDGREAVTQAEESAPDLVVMDIKLAGMDGAEAMTQIRNNHNELPVILNTAYAFRENDPVMCAADAYLLKQSDLSELKDTIARLLNKGERMLVRTELF